MYPVMLGRLVGIDRIILFTIVFRCAASTPFYSVLLFRNINFVSCDEYTVIPFLKLKSLVVHKV